MAVKEDTNGSRHSPGRTTPRTPREPRVPKATRKNDRFIHDIIGIALIALGLFTAVSLAAVGDTGAIGKGISSCLSLLFGVGSFVTPFLLIGGGVVLITGKHPSDRSEIIGGSVSLWLILLAWWDYQHRIPLAPFDPDHVARSGGMAGAAITFVVHSLVGIGTPLV